MTTPPGNSIPASSDSEIIEIPRSHDLFASLAVAVGLPLIMLAGILKGLNPDPVARRASILATTNGGSSAGPGRNWSPELSAMQARLDEAEQRNAILDAELEKLLSEIRQAREEARLAKQQQAEAEIVQRERLQGFAYQVAGMTQRIADGRETQATLRTGLAKAQQEGRSVASLAGERGAEINRLKGEVAALTEIGKIAQTRLVAVQNLADARKRDADALTNQIATERDQVAQARQELVSVRTLADQRLVQIGRLETERKESADAFRVQLLAKKQDLESRDQRIGSLERSLGEVRTLTAKQAAELQAAEVSLGSLRQAVSSLSSGLVK